MLLGSRVYIEDCFFIIFLSCGSHRKLGILWPSENIWKISTKQFNRTLIISARYIQFLVVSTIQWYSRMCIFTFLWWLLKIRMVFPRDHVKIVIKVQNFWPTNGVVFRNRQSRLQGIGIIEKNVVSAWVIINTKRQTNKICLTSRYLGSFWSAMEHISLFVESYGLIVSVYLTIFFLF